MTEENKPQALVVPEQPEKPVKKPATKRAASKASAASKEADTAKKEAKEPVSLPERDIKAKQYMDFIKENKINYFTVLVPEGSPGTTVFRTFVTVEGENLPMWVEVDESPLVMIFVRLGSRVVAAGNRADVLEYFTAMNSKFKAFKYALSAVNEPLVMSCVPFAPGEFRPELLHGIMDLITRHLEETYADFMRLVWSK